MSTILKSRRLAAAALTAAAAGSILCIAPAANAMPVDCRSLNLLSSEVFPEGYNIPPRWDRFMGNMPGYVCQGGVWHEYH
ncbi:hypothetical protein AB0L53_58620 [Nonomuraea sp. NPDC052129]|uniref:hypothetical protein n=1 Tax=Nonomuraea sp. NPDC052129 TaxID=3154651 RepID=UPI00342B9229